MLLQYPKLDKELREVLQKAGFQAIKSYFSALVPLKHTLAKQEAKEFIAAVAYAKQRHANQPCDKVMPKTEAENFSPVKDALLKEVQWMTLSQQIKPEYQAWYKTQRQQLNDKTWWKSLEAKTKGSEFIYSTWEAQDKYKYYRSGSVGFVYNTVLPVFTHWLKLARTELKLQGDKLTALQKNDYKKFLNTLANFIDNHKKALRVSMLERLTAGANQQDIRFDDVTVATLGKLEAIGAMETTEKPALPLRGMTPSTFLAFIQILQQEGSAEERQALNALPYFKLTAAVTSCAFAVLSGRKSMTLTYLVPTACADFIPKRPPFYLKLPRFLQRLFAGIKLRYEFFQHQTAQYLLAAHTTLKKLAIPESLLLADLNQLPLLHDAHYFETIVHQELQRQENQLKNLSRVLYQKERAMLRHYHQHLKKVGATLMFKKVDLLEAIVHQYAKRDTNLKTQEKVNLRALLEEIKADQKRWGLHFKFLHLETLCHMNLLLDKQVPPLTQRENNLIQAQAALAPMLAKTLPETFEQEIIKNPFMLTVDALPRHAQALQAVFTTLTVSQKSVMAIKTLNSQVYHYIYRCVDALIELGSKENWLANAQKINLILTLLKTLSHDNKALQDVVANLAKAHSEIENFDWEVIVDFKLNPEKNALEVFLNKRQSLPITEAELALHNVQKITDDKLCADVVNDADENHVNAKSTSFSMTHPF